MQVCFGELESEDDVVGTFLKLPENSHVVACLLDGLQAVRYGNMRRLDLLLIARLTLHAGTASSSTLAAVQSHPEMGSDMHFSRLGRLTEPEMAMLAQAARDVPAVGQFLRSVHLDLTNAPPLAMSGFLPLPAKIIDREHLLIELNESNAPRKTQHKAIPILWIVLAIFLVLVVMALAALVVYALMVKRKRLGDHDWSSSGG